MTLSAALAITLSAGVSSAQLPAPAPTQEQAVADDELIASRLAQFQEWTTTTDRSVIASQVQAKSLELLSGIDISQLMPSQIEKLLPMILQARDPIAPATDRLGQLLDHRNIEGLLARTVGVTMAGYTQPPQRPSSETVNEILSHSALNETIAKGHVLTPFIALSLANPADLVNHTDRILGLASHLDGNTLTPEQAQSLSRYWQIAQTVAPKGDERLAAARGSIGETLRVVSRRTEDVVMKSVLGERAAEIDGAFARGELFGHPAPDTHFIWTSEGTSVSSLEELKGKVVLVDFWATWCGPCIRSFPKLRSFAERYADSEVVILGATAPQGRHHGANGERITTGPDREREFELMGEFIAQKRITWPIVFTERSVWTEFGVEGIPHVAIIDAEGVVRHRGINPLAARPQDITDKIDTLLEEAGYDAPSN